jgi:hypothetical protein
LKEFIVNPINEGTVQDFLHQLEEILKLKEPVKITMKKYTQSSLPQKALLHIWVREYAAYHYKKSIKELSDSEQTNMKVTLKQRAYKEYGWDFLTKKVTNVETGISAHILESISEYDKGECYMFMEFMQDYCAAKGLILESSGEFKRLKDESMGQ